MTLLVLSLTIVGSCLLMLYYVTPMSVLVMLFFATCLISVFYWEIFQPILLRHISFRLFENRDELRRMAIDGRQDYRSQEYAQAEEFLCKTIAIVPVVNLLTFVTFSIHHRHSDNREICSEVKFSPDVEALLNRASVDGLMIMFVNSPFVLFFSALFASVLLAAGKINKLLITRKAEDFVYHLPLDLASDALPTRFSPHSRRGAVHHYGR